MACEGFSGFVVVTDASCSNPASGTANLHIEGGSGNYTYLWNTGATDFYITGLTPGKYTCTITDTETECVLVVSGIVSSPVVGLKRILADNLAGQINYQLYGGKPCCDKETEDAMIWSVNYIMAKYANPDASRGAYTQLNSKQLECMCNWVNRKYPLAVS